MDKELSLFDRLGGIETVNEAIKIFKKKVSEDEKLALLFDGLDDANSSTENQTFFVNLALGNRNKLDINSLEKQDTINAWFGTKKFEFVLENLLDTLKEIDVNQDLIDEVKETTSDIKNKNQKKSEVINSLNTNPPNNENMEPNGSVKDTELVRKISKRDSKEMANIKTLEGIKQTIDASFAFIEFSPKGTILSANSNFVSALGYESANEFVGKHHRIFCDDDWASTEEYKKFWDDLGSKGKTHSGQYKRLTKDGKEIWIQAAYTPLKNELGDVEKVIKIASDITDQVAEQLNARGVKSTIDSSFAYIEFDNQGNILDANSNFVAALGYDSADEFIGKHHRVFCEEEWANSQEYKQFWDDLGKKGLTQSGQYKRLTKGGKEIWIQAAYTPLKDDTGNIIKVIKIASDVTEEVLQKLTAQGMRTTIDSSFAYIEFDNLGNILDANSNFVAALGYASADEFVGKHHRVFCEEEWANTQEYKQFWDDLGKKGLTQSGQYKRLTKDGKEIWIQAAYTPLKDDTGTVTKVIKIAIDITADVIAKLNAQGIKDTVDASFAYIEFDKFGNIADANGNFVQALGYGGASDIVGQHHRIFCEPSYANSIEYKKFWEDLGSGLTQNGEFKRITKQGQEIWIQASYTPVKDNSGEVIKVIKIATEITEQKLENADFQGQMEAVGKSMAVIEFNLDGTIRTANENFLNTVGYNSVEQIKGKHHRIFCTAELANSIEYREFWQRLNNGEFINGEFERVGASGNTIWLQASYNPIRDLNGNPFKIVKYATDISGVKLPVMEVSEIIKGLAEGNLTQTAEIQSTGYVKEMADALNVAIENLNGLLGNIGKSATTVSASSEQMLDKSEVMLNSANESAAAVSQMAEGAQDQAVKTDETSKLIEDVMKSANMMDERSNTILQAAQNGQESCQKGLEIMASMLENMTEIGNSANLTSESIDVLTERAEEIARTLKVITDIAAQTNLLALNAAIEAARAGDAGRGFAVVAEEIRKLADASKNAAIDIEKIIGDVQKDTQAAGKAIGTMTESVKLGDSASQDAEGIFREINSSSEETLEFSKEIQNASVEQKSSIDMVVKNIEQIVVVSEETAAGSQQVSASSEEMAKGMNEMSDVSRDLAVIAEELLSGVDQFKLLNDSSNNLPAPVKRNVVSTPTRTKAKATKAKSKAKASK